MIDVLKRFTDMHPRLENLPEELALLYSIALDTRKMLLLAEENQTYIRDTMGYGKNANVTQGEGNDTANGSDARSEPGYHTD